MPTPPVTIGFWQRMWAFVVDTAFLSLILLPAGLLAYQLASWLETGEGMLDLAVNGLLPFILVFWFWKRWLATPGKMLIPAEIVDARTLAPPGSGQLLVRYLGYFVSLLPFGLGMLWILWDPRHQGWHDKLANTLVVRSEVDYFSPRMRRLLHGVSALLGLLLLAGVGFAGVWAVGTGPGLRGSFQQLREAADSGTLQGVMGNTDSCWDGAWNLSPGCSGPLCALQGSFFLRSCLENCRPTPDTCLRVLPQDQLSVSYWQSRCAELKRPGAACVLLMGTLSLYCRTYSN